MEKELSVVEQAQQKAIELSQLLGFKVHAIVFKDPVNNEDIVGFLKEPSRLQKIAVMDKMTIGGAFSASSELLDIIILKEHSNPRIYSERSEDDAVYIGACKAASELIKVLVEQSKKKN